MSSVLSSLKDRLKGNVHPKNSDEFIEKDGLYPFYVPTDEWDSSYDVTIYLLKMYKNKNTEDVHFDHPHIKRPMEETIFDKEEIESLADIQFRLHGDEVTAISAYIIKPETLPQDIRKTMRNSPIMNSDTSETVSEDLRNRIPSTYKFSK